MYVNVFEVCVWVRKPATVARSCHAADHGNGPHAIETLQSGCVGVRPLRVSSYTLIVGVLQCTVMALAGELVGRSR
jgi:hypothetical protein